MCSINKNEWTIIVKETYLPLTKDYTFISCQITAIILSICVYTYLQSSTVTSVTENLNVIHNYTYLQFLEMADPINPIL